MILKEGASVQIIGSQHWFGMLFWVAHVEARCENIQVLYNRLDTPLRPETFMIQISDAWFVIMTDRRMDYLKRGLIWNTRRLTWGTCQVSILDTCARLGRLRALEGEVSTSSFIPWSSFYWKSGVSKWSDYFGNSTRNALWMKFFWVTISEVSFAWLWEVWQETEKEKKRKKKKKEIQRTTKHTHLLENKFQNSKDYIPLNCLLKYLSHFAFYVNANWYLAETTQNPDKVPIPFWSHGENTNSWTGLDVYN